MEKKILKGLISVRKLKTLLTRFFFLIRDVVVREMKTWSNSVSKFQECVQWNGKEINFPMCGLCSFGTGLAKCGAACTPVMRRLTAAKTGD